MKKVLLYSHGTSYNHGCEAIVRTVSGIISEKYPDAKYTVSSIKPDEDREYIDSENGRYTFVLSDLFCKFSFETRRLITGGLCTVLGTVPFFSLFFKNTVKAAENADIAISVGGDTYSYGKSAALTAVDREVRKRCPKTVLWGCSINPELLDPKEHKKKIEGLKEFDLITARETITYETLKNLGFDNVRYYPDPAFTLKTVEPEEPLFRDDSDVIGINISPLAQLFESGDSIMLKNYAALVRYILENTEFNIALVSHVRCQTTDDSDAARKLMTFFPNEERIKLFDKGNAMEMKGIISKCRIFVAARTHASIAAYSNCIPTLVVGYSVKAKGIAKDLFGTDEGYVLPVQTLCEEDSLTNAFLNILNKENEIRMHLVNMMPDYILKAHSAGDEIVRLLSEK